MKKNAFRGILLGLIYVAISLVIGEQHPFTLVPMYNGFQNYAYSFYMTTADGKLLPFHVYFDCKDDFPSHLYGSICDKIGVNAGNETETDIQLNRVGEDMLLTLKKRHLLPLPKGEIQIHRICYYSENGLIKSRSKKMYSGYQR